MKKLSKALKTVPGLLCCHELEAYMAGIDEGE